MPRVAAWHFGSLATYTTLGKMLILIGAILLHVGAAAQPVYDLCSKAGM